MLPGIRDSDGLTDTTLFEVKDTKYVSLSSQLRDLISVAQDETVEFVLVVNDKTKLSKRVQRLADNGVIKVLRFKTKR